VLGSSLHGLENEVVALRYLRSYGRGSLRILGVMIATAALVTACSNSARTASRMAASSDFAARVDIGDGRKMFIECRGAGAPTVVLVSGLDAAADLWHRPEQIEPTVFTGVAKLTRVCAYDRPGAPQGAGLPSRSDPVAQPTTPKGAVEDLQALLRAARVPGPYVLVGHSYGGLVTRLFASTYPDEVSGMVLVDIFSDGLRDAMTPEDWTIWKKANARLPQDIAEYPALERTDYDAALDQIKAARPIRPMPLVVLSADAPYGPIVPALIDKGDIPLDTPRNFGYVIDRANKVAQNALAELVPGARHITDTHSGHNMMIDQPQLVIDAIDRVVAAVRRGKPEVAD
jgi:pimeloyl-ACP methyl ester carboxylesterase